MKKNFCKVILDIQSTFKSRRMRRLTIEGKIIIFKSLALSKVVYLALLTMITNHFINEMIMTQTNFIWKNTPLEIKHKNLILEHKHYSLKYAGAAFTIISLQ